MPVAPIEYYHPVLSLLTGGGAGWRGMRTVAQVRRDTQTGIPVNKDSLYGKEIARPAKRQFNTAPVPKKLQEALPFASKPKLEVAKVSESSRVSQGRERER